MDKSEFGKLLTWLRQRNGMTQSDLADALGVSVSAVSKWETGKNYPDILVFEEIRRLFCLTYDDLYYPAKTLASLKQGTFVSVKQEKESLSVLLKTNKRNKRIITVLSTMLFLLLTFLIVSAFWWHSSTEKPADTKSSAFWVYSSDYKLDEKTHQNIYEIVLVAEEGVVISDEIWKEAFTEYSEEWWSENPDTEVSYLYIIAYGNITELKKQSKPDHCGYYYRSIRLY